DVEHLREAGRDRRLLERRTRHHRSLGPTIFLKRPQDELRRILVARAAYEIAKADLRATAVGFVAEPFVELNPRDIVNRVARVRHAELGETGVSRQNRRGNERLYDRADENRLETQERIVI